jgi:CheY-like chemotaxis protein
MYWMDRKDVLIVANEQNIIDLMTTLVEIGFGLQPTIVNTKHEELAQKVTLMAERLCPSVIVFDLIEPGLVGLEVVSALKSKTATKAIPLVALTSFKEFCDRVVFAGCDQCLEKPFDIDTFFQAMAKYLPQKSGNRFCVSHR